jgi:hypothetical protein
VYPYLVSNLTDDFSPVTFSSKRELAKQLSATAPSNKVVVIAHGLQGAIRVGGKRIDEWTAKNSLQRGSVKTKENKELISAIRQQGPDGVTFWVCSAGAGKEGESFCEELAGALGVRVALATEQCSIFTSPSNAYLNNRGKDGTKKNAKPVSPIRMQLSEPAASPCVKLGLRDGWLTPSKELDALVLCGGPLLAASVVLDGAWPGFPVCCKFKIALDVEELQELCGVPLTPVKPLEALLGCVSNVVMLTTIAGTVRLGVALPSHTERQDIIGIGNSVFSVPTLAHQLLTRVLVSAHKYYWGKLHKNTRVVWPTSFLSDEYCAAITPVQELQAQPRITANFQQQKLRSFVPICPRKS